MTRSPSSALLAAGMVVFFFACSDDLPPSAGDSGANDVALHDGASSDGLRSDGQLNYDLKPTPDTGPLPDLGPGGCYENSDCDQDSFCKFAEGCGGPGMCVGRPPFGCPDMYDPQCGCDGFTWDSPCEAALNGVNILHPGGCGATLVCAGNNECKPDEFCNLDYGCNASSPEGLCELRPTNCGYVHAPVCGCDDMDYTNACEAHTIGVSVLHNLQCGSINLALCEQLNDAYVAAVTAANVCDDGDGNKYACDIVVQDALRCGCQVYITGADPNAPSTLDRLGNEWIAAGCNQIGGQCPDCRVPSGVDCLLDMQRVGSCVEYY